MTRKTRSKGRAGVPARRRKHTTSRSQDEVCVSAGPMRACARGPRSRRAADTIRKIAVITAAGLGLVALVNALPGPSA